MLNCEKSCRLIVFWCNFPSVCCALRTKGLLSEIRETKNLVQNVWRDHALGASCPFKPGSKSTGGRTRLALQRASIRETSIGAWWGKTHVCLRTLLLQYKRVQSLCQPSSRSLFHRAVLGLRGASSARCLRFLGLVCTVLPRTPGCSGKVLRGPNGVSHWPP